MPIIKAAIKDLRQSEKHRNANRLQKDAYKTGIKQLVKLVTLKKVDEAAKQLPAVFSLIDKAARHNLLHKNNASRKKSSLSRLVAKAK
ncbi:MAG: 30S ribosomal protein S20 [Candidatus Gracilibacteria bacterium]